MSNHAGRNGRTTTLLGPLVGFFGILIVIVLIIGIVIVPALLITNGTDAEKRPTTVVWVAVIIGVTSSIVIVLLSIVFCCLLLRGINRALPLFGATAVDRLLGLGVTILLLPMTAKSVFACGVKFIATVLRLIPSLLVNVLNIYASSASKSVGAQTGIVQRVLGPLRDSINTISHNSLERFPFAEFLIGLAVWALCGQLLRTVPAQTDSHLRTRFEQLAKRLSRVAWLNTLLFALIGIAFYFSIAAIVTVPSLIAVTSHLEPTSQTFQNRLREKSEIAKTKFDKEFPSNYGENNSLAKLESDLKEAENKKIERDAQEKIERLNRDCKAIRSLQEELLVPWNQKLKLAWDFNEKLITRAVEEFENANSVGNGTRELVQYYRQLEGWCDTNWDPILVDLRSDRKKIDLRNSQITKIAEQRLTLLRQLLSEKNNKTDNSVINSLFLSIENFLNRSKTNEIDSLMNQSEPDDSIDLTTITLIEDCPEVPELYLGPFRAIAGWLLETRSLPLAMIIGMLGFGLLGSAVSTFVREQSERSANKEKGKAEEEKRNTQDPLVTDLAGVLIRGLSAAIIVFLAASGGLAIIGTGQSAPNPYVLFLGCLVGAVFSQEVWDWARRSMQFTPLPPSGGDSPKTSHEPQSTSQPETSGTASSTDEPLSKASSVSDTSSHFDSLSEEEHSLDSTSEPGDSPAHQPPDTLEPKPGT